MALYASLRGHSAVISRIMGILSFNNFYRVIASYREFTNIREVEREFNNGCRRCWSMSEGRS